MTDTEFKKIIDKATKNFKGNFNNLESAVGMLMLGRYYGWKVIYLVHSRLTIKKYEKILDVKIRELLPD